MSRTFEFLGSSLGKKVVMAVTGVALFGFVLGHLSGNLLVYRGPEALNAYGEALRRVPALLWAARIGLLALAGLHIWAAVSLTRMNLAARPIGYREVQYRESTYASRTMRFGGLLLFLFIVYHLLHMTLGNAHGDFRSGDIYHNVITGFSVLPVSAFYIVAMLALGFHLYHGLWSMLQTVGFNHPRYNALRKRFAAVFAILVVAGNVSIPISVLAGVLKSQEKGSRPTSGATAFLQRNAR